jgi:hypothetical protein
MEVGQVSVCEVRVHLEPVDGGEIAWWAESDQLPGLSAAAGNLPALLDLVREELVDLGVDLDGVWFNLATEDEPVLDQAPATAVEGDVIKPATAGDEIRTRILDPILA